MAKGGLFSCFEEGCPYNHRSANWIGKGFATQSQATVHHIDGHGSTDANTLYTKPFPELPSPVPLEDKWLEVDIPGIEVPEEEYGPCQNVLFCLSCFNASLPGTGPVLFRMMTHASQAVCHQTTGRLGGARSCGKHDMAVKLQELMRRVKQAGVPQERMLPKSGVYEKPQPAPEQVLRQGGTATGAAAPIAAAVAAAPLAAPITMLPTAAQRATAAAAPPNAGAAKGLATAIPPAAAATVISKHISRQEGNANGGLTGKVQVPAAGAGGADVPPDPWDDDDDDGADTISTAHGDGNDHDQGADHGAESGGPVAGFRAGSSGGNGRGCGEGGDAGGAVPLGSNGQGPKNDDDGLQGLHELTCRPPESWDKNQVPESVMQAMGILVCMLPNVSKGGMYANMALNAFDTIAKELGRDMDPTLRAKNESNRTSTLTTAVGHESAAARFLQTLSTVVDPMLQEAEKAVAALTALKQGLTDAAGKRQECVKHLRQLTAHLQYLQNRQRFEVTTAFLGALDYIKAKLGNAVGLDLEAASAAVKRQVHSLQGPVEHPGPEVPVTDGSCYEKDRVLQSVSFIIHGLNTTASASGVTSDPTYAPSPISAATGSGTATGVGAASVNGTLSQPIVPAGKMQSSAKSVGGMAVGAPGSYVRGGGGAAAGIQQMGRASADTGIVAATPMQRRLSAECGGEQFLASAGRGDTVVIPATALSGDEAASK